MPVTAFGFRCQSSVRQPASRIMSGISLSVVANSRPRQSLFLADLLIAVGPRLGEATTGAYAMMGFAVHPAPPDPYPCRRGGARARLSSRPWRSMPAWQKSRRRCVRSGRRFEPGMARLAGPSARSEYEEFTGAVPKTVDVLGHRRSRWPPCRTPPLPPAAPPRPRRHQRRRQFRHLASPLFQYKRLGTQLAPTAARWATACRRRSRRSCAPCGRWSVAGDGDFMMSRRS